MRIGVAVAVALSLVAIGAAALVVGSTPAAEPEASPADDIDAPPLSLPPAPLLAARTARPSTDNHRAVESGARALDPTGTGVEQQTAAIDLKMEANESGGRLRPWVDPVVERIQAEVKRLQNFDDDRATAYVDLSDAEYRRAQERPIGIGLELSDARFLPNREAADVERWLEEPIDVSAFQQRVRASIESMVVTNRRQAARRYAFEVARLRADSLREYVRGRDLRRHVESRQDQAEMAAAGHSWRNRLEAWVALDGHGPDDDRELGELVRTIPSRLWAQDFDSMTR